MKCPSCAHLESKVIDSRLSGAGDSTRRRRECERCGWRFTTYERLEETIPLLVKKDGRREAFDRQKLLSGMQKACDKRAVPLEKIEESVGAIERDLVFIGEKEVSSHMVGEKVMQHLRRLDEVAYVRFASVYRSFRDIEEFRSELEKLAQARTEQNEAPL